MLPVLDISPFRAGSDNDATAAFVRDLRVACHGPGFFYLTGHGISRNTRQTLRSIAEAFFALPESERRAIEIGNSPHFRGYTVLGDEVTAGRNDWRDQIDIGPEQVAPSITADDPSWRLLLGPNQWPDQLPELKEVVTEWMDDMHQLSLTLVRALALGLGLEREFFADQMDPEPYPRVKISRYPGLAPGEPERQGLGPHHDSGLFTFILQNDVSGLQVWIDDQPTTVEPMEDAFVVNLGEMFQLATNGYLRATRHQVVLPKDERQRISIAYFSNPRLDAVFEPVVLPAELAAQARGGQNADPDDPVHNSFGENTLKIRMRAHPDVTRRFYSGG